MIFDSKIPSFYQAYVYAAMVVLILGTQAVASAQSIKGMLGNMNKSNTIAAVAARQLTISGLKRLQRRRHER
jgi:hypothetical protein